MALTMTLQQQGITEVGKSRSEICVEREGLLLPRCHDARLLVVAHALLEEVRLAFETERKNINAYSVFCVLNLKKSEKY